MHAPRFYGFDQHFFLNFGHHLSRCQKWHGSFIKKEILNQNLNRPISSLDWFDLADA